MHLIEVLTAGGVFAIAASSSVQLWSAMAVQAHQLTTREQLEQQIEQDRLSLQTIWRSNAQTAPQTPPPSPSNEQGTTQASTEPSGSGCQLMATDLLALASRHAPPPSLRRMLELSPDGRSLQMQWGGNGTAHELRRRVVTPAGLGLCGLESPQPGTTTASDTPPASDTPLTDSPPTDSPVQDVPS